MSKSKPWNIPLWMCLRYGSSRSPRVGLLAVVVDDDALGRGVLLQQVLHHADQEARRAAGRVADDLVGLRLDQIDHEPDDVPGRAELAVDAGRGQLAEQVLVRSPLVSPSVSGRASIMLTAETSRLGF